MNERIANFTKFYQGISTYGPALAQNEALQDSYLIAFNDFDFASRIYETVQMEEALWKMVNKLHSGELITICGSAGSGKSSISVMVRNGSKKIRKISLYFWTLGSTMLSNFGMTLTIPLTKVQFVP